MNNSSNLAQPNRLDRLLGYLGADPHNQTLLAEALQLVTDEQLIEQGQVLLAHIEKYAPPGPAVAAHAALLELQLAHYPQAAAYGEAAIAAGIDALSVRFNTAYAQLYCGNAARVDELLTEADGYDEYPAEYLLLKARALHHLERPDEAETLLQLAIGKSPDNADALGLLALLQQEDDRLDAAMQNANLALTQNPQQLEALLALAGVYFDQDDMPNARAAYEDTVRYHATSGRAWSGLGQIAFAEFNFETAEKYLLEAVRHMTDHIGTWHVLAWIYILQGNAEKAREVLLKSYEIDRSFGDTHGGLAVVDVMQGKDEEARIGIRKSLRLAPDSMAAHYAELLLLEKAGNSTAARQLVEDVLNKPTADGKHLRRTLVEQKLKSLPALKPMLGQKTH